MENERLKQIRKRCEVASASPWYITYSNYRCECAYDETHDEKLCSRKSVEYIGSGDDYSKICETDSSYYGPRHDDAEFISHSREDIPWLLEQLEIRDKALELACKPYYAIVHSFYEPEYWLARAKEALEK